MANMNIQDNSYYQISGWQIKRLKLKGLNLQLFAIIYGFTQDGESEFSCIDYLCNFTGESLMNVRYALRYLVSIGLLKERQEADKGIYFKLYRVNLEKVNEICGKA